MKMRSVLFAALLLISFTDQVIPRHNVYFSSNSSELNGTGARVVEAIYLKLEGGEQIRFGIKGPITHAHNIAEQNQITADRAKSIVSLIKKISKGEDKVEIVSASVLYSPTKTERGISALIDLEILVTKAPAWVEPAFTSIDEYLPMPVQYFTINPREDNRLVGNQGTVINIAAFTLELKNGLVPSEMTIELKEVYGSGQIVNANIHTNSRGRMLQTGGTIHLAANAIGKAAQVASGKNIDLEFPSDEEEQSENMEVFNGRIDRNGNFDWVQGSQTIERISVTREKFYINEVEVNKDEYYQSMQEWEDRKAEYERLKKEEKQLEDNFAATSANDQIMDAYLLSSNEVGWINCDEFYDIEEKTDMIVMVDTSLRPSVRMVFDNIRSVMNGYYNPRNGTVTFTDIPVGETVRIVGYSIKDNIPYMANKKITVSENLKSNLSLVATTKKQMELELASLN